MSPALSHEEEVFSTPEVTDQDLMARVRDCQPSGPWQRLAASEEQGKQLQQDLDNAHATVAAHQKQLSAMLEQKKRDASQHAAEVEAAHKQHALDVNNLQGKLGKAQQQIAEMHQAACERREAQEKDLEAAVQTCQQIGSKLAKPGSANKDLQQMAELAAQDGSAVLAKLAASLADSLLQLQERHLGVCEERRKLHNQLTDMKGAIRVVARARPMSAVLGLKAAAAPAAVQCNPLTSSIDVVQSRPEGQTVNGRAQGPPKASSFTFDSVHGPLASQQAVFRDAESIVTSVLDGYSVCLFAYGQTGSGKTHTLQGPAGDPGINMRTLEALFRQAASRAHEATITLHVSMVEVYMENIRDLLTETGPDGDVPRERLDIKRGPHGLYVSGLTEHQVGGAEEAGQLLAQGSAARQTAETGLNERSSRSHSCLCIRICGTCKLTGDEWQSRLWLVDLAGSERIGRTEANGERLKEAQFINRSLSALGDCIHALTTHSPHIPFRNSKLTYLLQDSLSGGSKALMVVNVSPEEASAAETLCSLNFAARVRGIQLGPAKRKLESGSQLSQLRRQIAGLQAQVAQLQAEGRRLEEASRAAEEQAGQERRQTSGLASQVRSCRARIAQQDLLLHTAWPHGHPGGTPAPGASASPTAKPCTPCVPDTGFPTPDRLPRGQPQARHHPPATKSRTPSRAPRRVSVAGPLAQRASLSRRPKTPRSRRSCAGPSRRNTTYGLHAQRFIDTHADAVPSQDLQRPGIAHDVQPAAEAHPSGSAHGPLAAAGEAGSESAAAQQHAGPAVQLHMPASARLRMGSEVKAAPASRGVRRGSLASFHEAQSQEEPSREGRGRWSQGGRRASVLAPPDPSMGAGGEGRSEASAGGNALPGPPIASGPARNPVQPAAVMAKPPRPPKPFAAASQTAAHGDAQENLQSRDTACTDPTASALMPPRVQMTPARKQQISWNTHPLPVHLASLTKDHVSRASPANAAEPAGNTVSNMVDGAMISTASGIQTPQPSGRRLDAAREQGFAVRDRAISVQQLILASEPAMTPLQPPAAPTAAAAPRHAVHQPSLGSQPAAGFLQPPAALSAAAQSHVAMHQPTVAPEPAAHVLQPPANPMPAAPVPTSAEWAATSCSIPAITLQIAQDGTVTPARVGRAPTSMGARLNVPAGIPMGPSADMGMGSCMPASTPMAGRTHFAGIVPRLPLDGNRPHVLQHKVSNPLPRSGWELDAHNQDRQAQAASKAEAPVAPRSMADSKENYLAKFEAFRRSRPATSGSILGNLNVCPSPAVSGGSLSSGAARIKHAVRPSALSRGAERTPMSKSQRYV
ncbi:hypothetical protein WJX74_000562 [Apatococcus lobatus]|uniref:Kinesin motor domain-containing protein n=1 Tax=Apatococcus lobatus TaxID=904363 RepID=A0AAW1S8S9_9CHLO